MRGDEQRRLHGAFLVACAVPAAMVWTAVLLPSHGDYGPLREASYKGLIALAVLVVAGVCSALFFRHSERLKLPANLALVPFVVPSLVGFWESFNEYICLPRGDTPALPDGIFVAIFSDLMNVRVFALAAAATGCIVVALAQFVAAPLTARSALSAAIALVVGIAIGASAIAMARLHGEIHDAFTGEESAQGDLGAVLESFSIPGSGPLVIAALVSGVACVVALSLLARRLAGIDVVGSAWLVLALVMTLNRSAEERSGQFPSACIVEFKNSAMVELDAGPDEVVIDARTHPSATESLTALQRAAAETKSLRIATNAARRVAKYRPLQGLLNSYPALPSVEVKVRFVDGPTPVGPVLKYSGDFAAVITAAIAARASGEVLVVTVDRP